MNLKLATIVVGPGWSAGVEQPDQLSHAGAVAAGNNQQHPDRFLPAVERPYCTLSRQRVSNVCLRLTNHLRREGISP